MRDRMERLAVLPFSIGCVSQSSVAVTRNHPSKAKPEADPSSMRVGGGGGECLAGGKMKTSFGFLPVPKSNISAGLQRLIKTIKSFSQMFVYKEEVGEMEIGFPTDVKHVTHIGWDGSTTTSTMKNWDDFKVPELLSLPSISLKQFELAMVAQADAPTLHNDSIKII